MYIYGTANIIVLGLHVKHVVCSSPETRNFSMEKSPNLAIAIQSCPALWSALCLRKISANINHGTEWMFIGRDGGGGEGGEEGGGVCGANDGDREERGMFSPPSPSRPTRVASTQNGKKVGGNITSEKGGGKLAASTDGRTRIASGTPLTKPFSPSFLVSPRPERRSFSFGLGTGEAPPFLKRRDIVAFILRIAVSQDSRQALNLLQGGASGLTLI